MPKETRLVVALLLLLSLFGSHRDAEPLADFPAHLWTNPFPDLAELLRLPPLEERVHVSAALGSLHQLAKPVAVELPLEGLVVILYKQNNAPKDKYLT